ncbi:diphthamide biosynthesis protein 1-like protein [Chytridium lagenaria]|nr:diphthamide biosynthesis protein 1-like protein [Chytridium lagenaria]
MSESNDTPSRTDAARKRFALEEERIGNSMPSSGSIEDVGVVVKATIPVKQPPRIANQIPDDILTNEELNKAIAHLPVNYNFEIHKTLWQVRKNNATNVALQFPEGLLMYSLAIADILETFGHVETVVMGDVTYGACCIDDFTAKALGCDFMVHYGHSCLVPVDVTSIKTMYVFVDIGIDVQHFVDTVRFNFEPGQRLIIVATIQFVASLHVAKQDLEKDFLVTVPKQNPYLLVKSLVVPPDLSQTVEAILAQRPPSSVVSKDDDKNEPVLLYLGDGRFHLESIMIANPTLKTFRYDPYPKVFTRERYNHGTMRRLRSEAITFGSTATRFGLIIGTLGRQGSPKVYDFLRTQLADSNRTSLTVLLSEITSPKLDMFGEAVDVWVQMSCPRLSIDWGHTFGKPLLSPYEAVVALKKVEAPWIGDGGMVTVYPMDFYAKDSLGPWTPNHVAVSERKVKKSAVGKK